MSFHHARYQRVSGYKRKENRFNFQKINHDKLPDLGSPVFLEDCQQYRTHLPQRRLVGCVAVSPFSMVNLLSSAMSCPSRCQCLCVPKKNKRIQSWFIQYFSLRCSLQALFIFTPAVGKSWILNLRANTLLACSFYRFRERFW